MGLLGNFFYGAGCYVMPKENQLSTRKKQNQFFVWSMIGDDKSLWRAGITVKNNALEEIVNPLGLPLMLSRTDILLLVTSLQCTHCTVVRRFIHSSTKNYYLNDL